MPTRSYDLKISVANSTGFNIGNTIIGNTSSTSALIVGVEPNILKVKLNNVLQEFSASEQIHSNSAIITGSASGQKNDGLVPFISNTFASETTTAATTITGIEFNRFTSAKNSDTQNPIVRLISVYFPGEWYPPNENGNPTNDGEGRAWPNGFPIQFAQVIGATNEDISYNVIYNSQSYIPAPVNISGIDQSADGKINELSLQIFNVGNIISSLIENPYISGNNISNSVVALVNGEFVHGIDPRTVNANPADVGSAGSEAFNTLTRARANGLAYDATVVSDIYGMSNASFTFDQTAAVNGRWRNSTFDSRDLLGAVVNIKTTFAQFLDFWPEYSVLNDIYLTPPQQLIASYPGTQWFPVEPSTVFADSDATVPAIFGQPIGGLRNLISGTRSRGRKNELPNNRLDGAAVGVVGSGGSLPTGWFTTNMPTGTVEVLSVADKNGKPNIRVRFNGTPTGTTVGFFFVASTIIPAAQNQTWTSSAWVQQVGGALTNISQVRIQIAERDASGTFLAGTTTNFQSTVGEDLRRSVTRTMVSASTGRTSSSVEIINSGAIDIILDINLAQLEQAASISAPQITFGSGADDYNELVDTQTILNKGERVAFQNTLAERPIYGRHPESGLRNMYRSSITSDAVLGIIGSGGAMPTHWSASYSGGAAGTIEIVAVTDQYIDLTINQTAVAGALIITFDTISRPAFQGDPRGHAVDAMLISGNLAATVTLRASIRDASDVGITSEIFGENLTLTQTMQRFERTRTLTTSGSALARYDMRFAASATHTVTVRIGRPQIEHVLNNSTYQRTSTNGFDVTEPGQRSVYYLQPDGVDDWMALTTAFQPISTYTMAVAQDHTTVTTATVSVFFGRGSGGGGLQYARRGTNSLALRANSSTNVTTHTSTQLGSAAAGRAVFVSRVADAGLAQTYANGVGPLAGTLTGVMLPAAPTGIGALFRTSTEYGRNRFYSGVLVPAAITEQERLSLEQYLTERLQAPPEFDWFVRVKNSSVYRTGDNVISTAGNVESTVLAIDANNTIYLSNQLDLATQINRPLYIINQEADAESYIEDIFKIEQLESLTEDVATFGLVSWLQYFKSVLPKRRYYKNTCQWRYKGPECQYPENGTGTIPGTVPAVSANGFFTNNNVVTTDPNDDVCSKSFAACSLRRNTLHFGGFPGTGRSVPKV